MKKSKISSIALASALILVLCFTTLTCTTPQAESTVPIPTVTGPIPVTATSRPFNPSGGTNFESLGYVEEEYFISGKANEYELVAPDDTSSFAVKIRTPDLPYTTRMLVRRPADPKKFNGNVIVEFMNPTANYDMASGWPCFNQYMMRNGDAWVGITCRGVTIRALKKFDPTRYEPLSLAKERAQAWDIFTQVGALLKSKDKSNPLREFKVEYLYGHGYSQTCSFLIAYINFFHPLAKLGNGKYIYDGYLAAAAGGAIYINDDDLKTADEKAMGFGGKLETDPRRVIQPSGVPVIHIMTETEIATPIKFFNAVPTRRPDSDTAPDLFRRYEIAGGCHVDINGYIKWAPPVEDQSKAVGSACPWCCAEPASNISDFPQRYIWGGCLANLEKWVRTGTLPPKGNLIQVESGKIVRDEFGNAKGGLRSPWVDVPIKTYKPFSTICPTCPPPDLCATCSLWCYFLGNVVPFDEAKLEQLYSDHDGYVAKFNASADKMFQNGFVTQADLEQMKSEAADSDVLK
ncbi:MAG: alpha/beta hydrolase domain-containing protein [Dehalococcoidia bacterium]